MSFYINVGLLMLIILGLVSYNLHLWICLIILVISIFFCLPSFIMLGACTGAQARQRNYSLFVKNSIVSVIMMIITIILMKR